MAISEKLNRRIRAVPEEDAEVYSENSASEDQGDGFTDSGSDDGSDDIEMGDDYVSEEAGEESEEESEEEEGDDIQASLSNISFGALAKAQASMGSKKKRKENEKAEEETGATASPLDEIRARLRDAREQKAAHDKNSSNNNNNKRREKPPSRSSKHAPMVLSSKYAVSRKRNAVELPAVAKSRDPRFDPAVLAHGGGGRRKQNDSEQANNAYAFLDDYRAAELKELKEKMARTKNATEKENLKREVRSAMDRMRTLQNRRREREVLASHRQKEKQLLREGKKSTPYFLKKSDLKKQVLVKKYEEMGSKERAKALERRRKKTASKERKEMPMARRTESGV
ncbi:hypothetical protein ASPZODRAFT_135797 [Penicilliopsis zonata CBS 506.65]|uniref:rRNA biogenesis protein RRP36 n=1 Tax=Penicilliopsis zonata CBS 506.65 TaxID=1073090 RepID=A0A1L9S9E1_9EURO|nr:hypothetical protein ASPZODRAFT_135797 [Penicilliopsis zonata CBS 506.65]OJJ43775.1 hypothetical protein ASPZODRAFT_135797 [Penicilliopsis zonata CBS 506.65]